MKPKIYNLDLPMYGVVEAARYLRLPYPTLKYWVNGSKKVPPLIKLPGPHTLSFANLLECHILSAMRSMYDLRLPRIRNSIAYLDQHFDSPIHCLNTRFIRTVLTCFCERWTTM